MPEQLKATKNDNRTENGTGVTGDDGAAQRKHAEAVKAETDAILDEIDAVLADQFESESEMQSFVNLYVQKGGE